MLGLGTVLSWFDTAAFHWLHHALFVLTLRPGCRRRQFPAVVGESCRLVPASGRLATGGTAPLSGTPRLPSLPPRSF